MKTWTQILILFVVLIIVSLVWTYPLARYFNKGIPVGHQESRSFEPVALNPVDSLETYYHLWSFKQALLKGQSPFHDNYQFSVGNTQAIIWPWGWLASFLFLFFSVFGNIPAYNLLIILAIPAAGVSTYLLAFHYTKKVFASIAAALTFALAPYILSKLLVGHRYSFLVFLLPLALYFLEKTFSERSLRHSVLAGITVLLVSLSDPNLAFYFTMFLLIFLPYRLLQRLGTPEGMTFYLKLLIPVFGFFLLGVGYSYAVKVVALDTSFSAAGRPWEAVVEFSPRPVNLLFKNWFGYLSWEKNIYLSLSVLIIVALGMVAGLARRLIGQSGVDVEFKSDEAFFGAVLVISAILALGASIDRYLPVYRFFYSYVPFFNYTRTPGRIVVFAHLSLALLVGFAIVRLQGAVNVFPRATLLRTSLSAILGILVIFVIVRDYYPPPAKISLLPGRSRVYEEIKRKAGDGKVLQIPISWHYSVTVYEYYATISETKMINGYSPLTPSNYLPVMYRLSSVNYGNLNDDVYRELRRLKVKYIVVYPRFFDPLYSASFDLFIRRFEGSGRVDFITSENGMLLFELK